MDIETVLASPKPQTIDEQSGQRITEFPTVIGFYQYRQLPATWTQGPPLPSAEAQSGQTITVEPLSGCGSNLWRAYKRQIEAQFTWTTFPLIEAPVSTEMPPRPEWPTDVRWFDAPARIREHSTWLDEPQVSHWCEVGAVFLFTAANWGGSVGFFFEVYMRAFVGMARARLFNLTDNTPVFGSEVLTTDPVMTRVRSGAIALTDGREYVTQIAADPTNATAIMSSRVIGV